MYSDAVDKLKKIWEIMFILFFCLRLLKMVGKPIMGEGRFTNGGERVAFTLPPPPTTVQTDIKETKLGSGNQEVFPSGPM